jgi:hypothetical protein
MSYWDEHLRGFVLHITQMGEGSAVGSRQRFSRCTFTVRIDPDDQALLSGVRDGIRPSLLTHSVAITVSIAALCTPNFFFRCSR